MSPNKRPAEYTTQVTPTDTLFPELQVVVDESEQTLSCCYWLRSNGNNMQMLCKLKSC